MKLRTLHAIAAAGAVALVTGIAVAQEMSPEEKATGLRKGLMQLISNESGPLFGMAKGDVPYDAEQATLRAKNLAALAQYAGHTLFVPATSVDDLPGKTRALPAIWQDQDKFHQGFTALADQTAVVVAEAGKGQEQLAAAVGELGKVCGNCHETFREKK